MSRKGSSFLTTFGLMSRIKINYSGPPRFTGSLIYIPLIGLLVTIILFGIFTGLERIIPDPFIIVLIILIVQYGLFNLFHFDGYLDTADAFLYHTDKEKRLSILKDSRVGAFALFFGALYIGAKLYILTKSAVYFYILGSDPLSRMALIFLFFSYPIAGRSAASLVPLIAKPAKTEGLGAALKEAKAGTALIGILLFHIPTLGLFFTAHILYSAVPLVFLLSCSGALAAFIFTAFLYKRKVGGYTGDTFGCAIEIGELLYLFIFYLLLTYGLG